MAIWRAFPGVVCMVIALAGVAASPQKSAIKLDHEGERRSFGVNLLRAINTAELDYKNKHSKYADWAALFGNGDFTETGTKWAPEGFPTVGHAMYTREVEIVPGWKLRLNVSHDGQKYDLLLEDATDPKCGYALVTDERGVIRQSKAIDCSI